MIFLVAYLGIGIVCAKRWLRMVEDMIGFDTFLLLAIDSADIPDDELFVAAAKYLCCIVVSLIWPLLLPWLI